MKVNRRDFLQKTAGTVAAGSVLGLGISAELQAANNPAARITSTARSALLRLDLSSDFELMLTSLSAGPFYALKDTAAARNALYSIGNSTVRSYEGRRLESPLDRNTFVDSQFMEVFEHSNSGNKFLQIDRSDYDDDRGDCTAFTTALFGDNLSNMETFGRSIARYSYLRFGDILVTPRSDPKDPSGHVLIVLKKTTNHIWAIGQNGAYKTNRSYRPGIIELHQLKYDGNDSKNLLLARNYKQARKE